MTGATTDADVVVIGGGIVGLATAWTLTRAGRAVTVVEKEHDLASHQTCHNSGVIHSGIYYRPGSRKAELVARGRSLLDDFCAKRSIPVERCGKVIVATSVAEVERLDELAVRGRANGVDVERIGVGELSEIEPAVRAVAALHVPGAAIVDYRRVAAALAAEITEAGGEVRTGWPVEEVVTGGPGAEGLVTVAGPAGSVRASVLVNCAGLYSDRVARLAGADTGGVRIMPFRGEYLDLRPAARHLVRALVYPLPDPAFPFLGVHLTRMIDGGVHAGPNAVPALAREGYRWRDVDIADLREVLGARSSWRLARTYWRTGLAEIGRSLVRPAFVRAAQRLVPELTAADFERGAAGVRAQAIDAGGRLLDDFEIRSDHRHVHVLNAPSPAATASLAIGEAIASHVR